ncbi:hypothetical protein [uncultured Polaribacter sp.]|uniref:hypothetical protein n=1 Tax=uncultured Polaribacter sp. TaxID=174711 RepID=UPI00260F08E7|nr:hypothetical protein [uncultured Polaribacter sp.]
MKPIIFTLILFALVSCKESKKQENIDTENLYANTWVKEIKLDTDAKWQANSETNEGVQKMKNSIKEQKTNTLSEYHQLAQKLNNDKNYVIKNCTMKGDSHDNLHIWLLPLLAKINILSEVKTIKEALKIKESIKDHINKYEDYFE